MSLQAKIVPALLTTDENILSPLLTTYYSHYLPGAFKFSYFHAETKIQHIVP